MALARLPDAELEIMKILWDCGEGVSSAYVMEKLGGKKDWAVTTVLNFLARLADRGFVSVQRNGKSNIYTPLVCEDEYLKSESKSFLDRLHGNSLVSLIASLYGGDAISQDDLEELRRYIDERSGERP